MPGAQGSTFRGPAGAKKLRKAMGKMSKEELAKVLREMTSEDLKAALQSMTKDELQRALQSMSKEELKAALQNMSKEELLALKKAGKLKGVEGVDELMDELISDSEASDVTDDSDSDGKGGKKKKKKKGRPDSSYSYYSVTSEGGTRTVRRRFRREDGTYSDSESCHSDQGHKSKRKESNAAKGRRKSRKSLVDKEAKETKGKGKKRESVDAKDKKGKKKEGQGGSEEDAQKDRIPGVADADDEGSDYSVRSEVSEGGTRRKVKMKRIRDEDGNVVGYGDPMPADVRASSVAGRRGSIDGLSDRELDEDTRRAKEHLGELEKLSVEQQEAEMKRKRYQEEKRRAHEEKRQQRQNERAKAGDQPNMTQDGVLLVRGHGKDQEEEDEEGAGPNQVAAAEGVPSDFSDDSDEENVDFSKMTEEEKTAYLEARAQKRKEQEERRRAKYGDKYDEIMKKKKAKKEAQQAQKAKEEEEGDGQNKKTDEASRLAEEERKRRMSMKALGNKVKEKPKSMVSYDKGPPRWPQDKEKSELNKDTLQLGHERRNSRSMTGEGQRRLSRGGQEEFDNGKFMKLPPIKGKRGSLGSDDGEGQRRRGRKMHPRGETIDKNVAKAIAEKVQKEKEETEDDIIEFDEKGNLRLKKGKKIDLSKLSDATLRKLGIDPNLTAKEKAKLLKDLLGSDIMITEGSYVIGTKGLDEYDLDEVTDDMLAADMNLDLDTLSGQRRVNILFRRGGMLLKEHMKKVMQQSHLLPDEPAAYRNDLDEKGDIDFMQHYRLVEPGKLEGYARAFVVEDGDMDTVINLKEALTALDGVPTIQHMTSKQFDYVFKVLNINDATQVTFRMFAVITALCERVTCMDALSKHLLEICNLADIERKLALYRSMFYHNIQSGLDPNFITADSLKIELIAGGLSWLQQQYVMEKMEINLASEISFLDYMCYIPLFMSMHDNIVDNPLDMSDQKYTLPPRTRPISAQRDINPLGFPLSKTSSLQMRKTAKDMKEGKIDPSEFEPEMEAKLHKYAKLPEIKPMRRGASAATTRTSMSSVEKLDLIF